MNCREVSTNLDYSDYEISKEQAKEFAISIFADIKSYIETHQDDYFICFTYFKYNDRKYLNAEVHRNLQKLSN